MSGLNPDNNPDRNPAVEKYGALEQEEEKNANLLEDRSNWDLDACDDNDRMQFIRKVYGILSTQLLLTFGSIAVVKASDDLNEGIKQYTGLLILACIVAICVEIPLLCCMSVARKVPTNYILLLVFTLCETFMLSFVCAHYPASNVITAAAMTAVVTVALTIYAFNTKSDFTMCGGAIWIMCGVILMLNIVSIFLTFSSWWHPFMSAILCVFYGFFLIYDT